MEAKALLYRFRVISVVIIVIMKEKIGLLDEEEKCGQHRAFDVLIRTTASQGTFPYLAA